MKQITKLLETIFSIPAGYITVGRHISIKDRGIELAFRSQRAVDLRQETISALFGEQLRRLPVRRVC